MATIEFVQPKVKVETPIIQKPSQETINERWGKSFRKARIHMLLISLLVLVAINQLVGVFIPNPLVYINSAIYYKSGFNPNIHNIVFILAGITAIYLVTKRDFWLPFLGSTVLPVQVLSVHQPDKTNKVVSIKTKPNSKIVYWAAKSESDETDVKNAYDDYSNSGVVMSDEKGVANLSIQDTTGYVVPSGKRIKKHVHFRLGDEITGMMSPVQTIYY
jgi:hypothetical protein